MSTCHQCHHPSHEIGKCGRCNCGENDFVQLHGVAEIWHEIPKKPRSAAARHVFYTTGHVVDPKPQLDDDDEEPDDEDQHFDEGDDTDPDHNW
jgi:hypothetical protein